MRITWLADVLRDAGLTVIEHPNWKNHEVDSTWTPEYGIVHATAVQPVPAVSAVVLTVNVAACAGAATPSAKSPAKRAARTRISRH